MALYSWALSLGIGIRMNRARGEQLLQQSNHVNARAGCALYVEQDFEEAYRLLSTECDASDPHVQSLLGLCHNHGFGCKQDMPQAAQCFERAGNHLWALHYLAVLLHGEDFPIADNQRAIALYRQSATQGYAAAQYSLGMWYDYGLPGVLEKDIAQAKYWYSLAAEQGDVAAVEALERLGDG